MSARSRNNRQIPGFTWVETISIIVVFLVLVTGFFQWFSSHRIKSRMAEAPVNLKLIFDAEVSYYQHSQRQLSTNTETNEQFPNTKVFLPLAAQPIHPAPGRQLGDFSNNAWALLNVAITNPVYYSYSVETSGVGGDATFTAIARSDLDGDGHFSRWEMIGRLDPNEEVLGKDLVYSLDPFE